MIRNLLVFLILAVTVFSANGPARIIESVSPTFYAMMLPDGTIVTGIVPTAPILKASEPEPSQSHSPVPRPQP